MKNVASEVKLVHPRTRIALPKVELRNRAKRAQILSPHPIHDTAKLVHKTETSLTGTPKV